MDARGVVDADCRRRERVEYNTLHGKYARPSLTPVIHSRHLSPRAGIGGQTQTAIFIPMRSRAVGQGPPYEEVVRSTQPFARARAMAAFSADSRVA